MRFGIFIYDGVEPIDLATYGVLSMARRIVPAIEIATVARSAGPVALASGLAVEARHGIADAPAFDWLIVTGGPGWPQAAADPATLDYIRAVAARGRIASVCTGAMILAAAGVLDGLDATTKREVVPPEVPPIDVMRQRHPSVRARSASLVDAGDIVTGGGVAFCIDTTLYIIEKALGADVASETARILEYQRARAANAAQLPAYLAS